MTTAIKPILKFPGSTWRLAPWIVSYFPAHHHYLEPFCGSADCFFSKDRAPHEVLGDMNKHLINLFRVIREHGRELARQIEMTRAAFLFEVFRLTASSLGSPQAGVIMGCADRPILYGCGANSQIAC